MYDLCTSKDSYFKHVRRDSASKLRFIMHQNSILIYELRITEHRWLYTNLSRSFTVGYDGVDSGSLKAF